MSGQPVPESFEIRATYANYAQVTYSPVGVRITWGESSDGSDNGIKWREAQFVPLSVFTSLVQLFNETQAGIQKMQKPSDAKDN